MSEITSQPKKRKLWAKIGWPVVALLVGIGMGSAAQPVERVEVPGPERIVTKEVEVPVEVPGKQGVPEVCLTALTKADEGFEQAADGFELAGEAVNAVSWFDLEAVEVATEKMNSLAPKVERTLAEYGAARDECRGLR